MWLTNSGINTSRTSAQRPTLNSCLCFHHPTIEKSINLLRHRSFTWKGKLIFVAFSHLKDIREIQKIKPDVKYCHCLVGDPWMKEREQESDWDLTGVEAERDRPGYKTQKRIQKWKTQSLHPERQNNVNNVKQLDLTWLRVWPASAWVLQIYCETRLTQNVVTHCGPSSHRLFASQICLPSRTNFIVGWLADWVLFKLDFVFSLWNSRCSEYTSMLLLTTFPVPSAVKASAASAGLRSHR